MAAEIPKRLNPFECHVLDTARRRGLLQPCHRRQAPYRRLQVLHRWGR